MTTLRLSEIAEIVQGELVGNPDLCIAGIKPILESAPGFLSLLSSGVPPQFRDRWRDAITQNGGVVLTDLPVQGVNCIVVARERLAECFNLVFRQFVPTERFGTGVHPSAVIGDNVQLGCNVSIGAYCVVGDHVIIGEGTTLHPRVVVYPHCRLGTGCLIHSGW